MANILEDAVQTVDDVLGNVVGIKPAGVVERVAKTLAPATVINRFTGIPKPDSVLGPVEQRISSELQSKGGSLPSLPRPPAPF